MRDSVYLESAQTDEIVIGREVLGAAINVGKVRERQEDAFWVKADGMVFMVTDGMGGHRDGNKASGIAKKEFNKQYTRVEENTHHILLENLVGDVQQEIVQYNHENSSNSGATIVAAELDQDQLIIAHVGDSRAYLYRPHGGLRRRYYEERSPQQKLSLLTEDHSMVEKLRQTGQITEEQMEKHPNKNVINRALGKERFKPEWVTKTVVPVQDGDVVLLCTDGLMAAGLGWEEIENVLSQVSEGNMSAQEGSEKLVKEALDRRAPDNVTVVIRKIDQLTSVGLSEEAQRLTRNIIINPDNVMSDPPIEFYRKAMMEKTALWKDPNGKAPDGLTLNQQRKWGEYVIRIEKAFRKAGILSSDKLISEEMAVEIGARARELARFDVPGMDNEGRKKLGKLADQVVIWADTIKRLNQVAGWVHGRLEQSNLTKNNVRNLTFLAQILVESGYRKNRSSEHLGFLGELFQINKDEARELVDNRRKLVIRLATRLGIQ